MEDRTPNQIRKEKEKESEHKYIPILIIAIIIFGVGLFFLIKTVIDNYNVSKQEEISEKTKEEYNRLFDLLKETVDESKMDDREIVNDITSIYYQNNKFYIAGSSDLYNYNLEINISKEDINDINKSYEYLMDKNNKSYTLSLDRLDKYNDEANINKFINKYINDKQVGKYQIGKIGSSSKAIATFFNKDNRNVYLIDNVDIEKTILDTYSPSIITSDNPLYNQYMYIAIK